MNNEDVSKLTRRGFMAAGAAGAALTAFRPESAAVYADTTSVEQANLKLVNDACKAVSSVNPDDFAPYLDDDFVFQLIDNQPLVKGKDAFIGFMKTFFSPFERAEFKVHRAHVLGNLVINERTDHFFAKEGGKDQSFHVTGFCLVKDGKILEWKDYSVPQ